MTGKATEISNLLAPTVEGLGLELLGVEFAPTGNSALLRLYIDAPGRHVAIEDCEAVSREISAVLDLEDPITSQYTLEVSSPGIDRPLFTPAQFARFIGEQAKLNLRLPVDGRRRFQARIERVDGNSIVLVFDGREMVVAHENIEKARLVPDLVALGLAAQPKPTGPRGKRKAGNESDNP
ncbi:ribosome maturation factor RimP [Arenimonas soli]|uniref:Ribosome maturation factor RimP n=1 Tax=Arenimonas soli TaxID=2269504 RepID=A0ABQ1HI12_9GAMM|nr:ribosome maturation factor RimP [Arenimonas soli]GGA77108.1 ribosome maturation factor RimP [Arenimonas soli]